MPCVIHAADVGFVWPTERVGEYLPICAGDFDWGLGRSSSRIPKIVDFDEEVNLHRSPLILSQDFSLGSRVSRSARTQRPVLQEKGPPQGVGGTPGVLN